MPAILNTDLESRGPLDLTKVGAHKYAWHPETEITLWAYELRDAEFDPAHVKLWERIFDPLMPADLFAALLDPTVIIEAWNAQFERLMIIELVARMVDDAPDDEILKELLKAVSVYERYHCTAARARACALPGKLDLCARFLQTPIKKDRRGAALIKELCSPREDGTYNEDRQLYAEFGAYCVDDTRAEGLIGTVVRDLTATEWLDYHANERLNDRGIPVDVALAKAAMFYADAEAADIRKELSAATCGAIQTPKQYAKLKDWVLPRVNSYVQELLVVKKTNKSGEEVVGYTLDKAARASILDDPDVSSTVSDEVLLVLELVDDAGRSSIAKFQAIINREVEGRLFGCYILNGAGQTGRYSAHGFQPHNLQVREKIDNLLEVIDLIMAQAPATQVSMKSGKNILTTLACIMRPVVVAEEGKVLVWADFSAVEARALPWLSLEPSADELLQRFAANVDVYIRDAMDVHGVSEAEVLEDMLSTSKLRQGGKVSRLSLGFLGGAGALKKMARGYGLHFEDAVAEAIKVNWRRANPWAEKFGNRAHRAACNAVRSPGVVYEAGRLSYLMQDDTLWNLLPDGRIICYPEARVKTEERQWGPEDTLTCAKGSWTPAQGQVEWPRFTIWRGVCLENPTQGICASQQRLAIRLLDEAGWPVIMHTHDEIMLEVDENEVEDAKVALKEAMLAKTEWNKELPLHVAVTSAYFYGKG